MESNPLISDTLVEQIFAIRNSGAVNMFDVHSVQSDAHRRGFNELVLFLSGNRREYVDYILTGKR